MDSKDHPVVQQGIKAAELISNVSCLIVLHYSNLWLFLCYNIKQMFNWNTSFRPTLTRNITQKYACVIDADVLPVLIWIRCYHTVYIVQVIWNRDLILLHICFLQKAYREDWEADKSLIYFPAHITPGYEAALEATKATSDVSDLIVLNEQT